MSKQDTDDVVALERKFWSKANDPKFFQDAVADDGITVIEPMGFIQKADAVKYAGQGKAYKDVTLSDLIVRQVTPDTIIVAYHGSGQADGDEKPYHGSIASVYVKRDGRWQMALSAHQPWKPKDGKKS